MDEFNQWKKLLQEKKFHDRVEGDKIRIIPEQEEDKEIAQQMEFALNHHLAKEKVKC